MGFVLVILIHVYACFAYPLKCPEPAQWSTRAKALCPDSSKYYCLQNEIIDGFTESCSRMNDAQPGSKIILRGDMDVGPCSVDRYQPWPIIYKTNVSSGCIFMKTNCINEGQLVYHPGDTNTDTTCRCDYTKGYDFLFKPKHPCFCVPRIEDCSCYLKTCPQSKPVYSPDYKCLMTESVVSRNICSLIKTGSKNISYQHKMNGGFQQQEPNELPVLTFSKDAATSVTVLMLPLLGLFTIYFYCNDRISLPCQKGCETNLSNSSESVVSEPETRQAKNDRYTTWQVKLTKDEKIEEQSIKEETLAFELDAYQERIPTLPPKQTINTKEERQSTEVGNMASEPETHQDVNKRYTTLLQRKTRNTENEAKSKVECVTHEPQTHQDKHKLYTSLSTRKAINTKISEPEYDQDMYERYSALPKHKASHAKAGELSAKVGNVASKPETLSDKHERYINLPNRKTSDTTNEDAYERYSTLPKNKTCDTESAEKCTVEIVPPEPETYQDKHKLHTSLFPQKASETKRDGKPSTVESVAPGDTKNKQQSSGVHNVIHHKTNELNVQNPAKDESLVSYKEGSHEMLLLKSFQASKLGDNVEINKGCFISGNKLLLIQEDDYYLFVCDLDGSNAVPIKLSYKAECVTPYDRNQALVLDRNGVIQILNLSDLTLGKQITIGRTECSSFTSLGEHIWISYENVLAKIDINGKVLQMKKTNFLPCDICLSKRGDVYCSDDNSDKVFVLKLNNEVSRVVGGFDLRGTRGIAVDHKNQVYIAGKGSENIIRLSSDRSNHIVVLKAEHGIKKPIGLSYNIDARLLMVVNDNGDTIALYKT
ncbi:unnamed protein product [Mytilus coruscus]|uniref:Uncharacterized protein n=1 Tax=Mytilus coruscus TaxID=42192 RepID=A0A6J8ABP3_MYTCO|nr:unnamed protein product [Mytilus coruscus]